MKAKLLTGILLLTILISGCSNQESLKSQDSGEMEAEFKDYELEIQGLEQDTQTILLEDILTMESVEQELTNISSSGEVSSLNVKGVKLEDILTQFNTKQNDYNGIRFYAADGYSIEVPKEILDNKDIILFYEAEGEPIKEKHQPLRVGINEERAMYWVGNLAGFEMLTAEVQSIKNIVILEAASKPLEQEDYTYYESVDKAIKTRNLIDNYSGRSQAEQIYIESIDGLEKNESREIFLTGYIKISGDSCPLFLSPDLPKGMHVKDILYMVDGDTAFISMENILEKYQDEVVEFQGEKAIPLMSILDAVGVIRDGTCLITTSANDEIEIEDFTEALIYQDTVNVFNVHNQGEDIKDIVSINMK
jgi:hypothetical protein